MFRRSLAPASLFALVVWLLTAGQVSEAGAADAPQPSIKLAVLVVFDQMRGDYLTRWDELFGAEGFHRLEKEGAWFENCNYPYAGTVTGAGHASLATGCSPWKHGITGNNWYDRDTGTGVYCATTPERQRVPALPAGAAKPKKSEGGSPERLLKPSFADVYKEAVGDKARVVSLSYKDRGAVFTGGRKSDGCYWLEEDSGEAVTSTFYRPGLPEWVEAFNKEKLADRYFGKDWTRLRPDLDYAKYSGPDDAPGEGLGYDNPSQGRTFPHPMDGALVQPGPNFYKALYNSPFGDDLLLEFAKRAVDAEKLGTHEKPDLLCVSFSCTDPPGHCWGPDSQEVLDGILRADLVVKGLLDHLDARLGKGSYVVVLSADHGVCPLPEYSAAHGREAARLSSSLMLRKAEDFLQTTFAKEDATRTQAIATMGESDFYLNRNWVKGHNLEQAHVEEELAKWAAQQPGILKAYTRTELTKEGPAHDEVGQKVRRSYVADRKGDVLLVLKPYYLLSSRLDATTHGSPHSYDTHVPLLVFGPGVHSGVRKDAVTPQAAAPILAHALGVKPPPDAEAGLPEKLFMEP